MGVSSGQHSGRPGRRQGQGERGIVVGPNEAVKSGSEAVATFLPVAGKHLPRNELRSHGCSDQPYLMMARYYSSSLDRFLSADPSQKIGKSLYQPQRWNRYTYSLNNPLKYIDPDGRDVIVPNNARSAVVSGYMNSGEFRKQFNAAKNNPDIHATIKLVAPTGGGVLSGEKASQPDATVTPKVLDAQGKPIAGEGFTVVAPILIPAGKGDKESAALIDHELKHDNDMAKNGAQKAGTPAAAAGQQAAEGSEAQVREDYKDPKDNVSKEEAEKALVGTEPKKEKEK